MVEPGVRPEDDETRKIKAKGAGTDTYDPRMYCAYFFIGIALIIMALRTVDAILWNLPQTQNLEPLLQPVWSEILRRWPWFVSHVSFAGTVGIASFFISCTGFMILDISRSSTKIQKDWWPSSRDIVRAAVPQSVIYVVANTLSYVYAYQPIELPEKGPSLPIFLEQMLVAFVVGDFLIYWEHRFMHAIPFLRNHIHSVHHMYHAPFSWAGGVVHPLEDMVVIVCQIFAPICFGHHPLSFWTFVFIWTALLIEEHSGHDVWWAPYNWLPFTQSPCGGGAAPHDIHHYQVNKNYSFVLCVWDELFGTAAPVLYPPDLPKSRTDLWWEHTSSKEFHSKQN